MKRLPWDTLTGRMVLVVTAALVISQMLALTIIQARLETLIANTIRMSQLSTAVEALKRIDRQAQARDLEAALGDVSPIVGVWTSSSPMASDGSVRDEALEERLRRRAGLTPDAPLRVWVIGLEVWAQSSMPELLAYDSGEGASIYRLLHCAVEVAPDVWVNFVIRPQPRFWPPSPPLAVFLSFSLIFIAVAAALAARRIARPFRAFTKAAERLTAGQKHEPVRVYGPIDVRRAQTAFNVMGARLQATLLSQQALLAAIGHDLRTPLTALRVRTELLADEGDKTRMARALDELQRLTEAALDAATSAGADAPAERIDMVGLVHAVCDDLIDLGAPVAFREGEAAPIIEGWPEDLTRAVRNIIENAVRYGDRADVSLRCTATHCVLAVQDQGPGIPEADQERVFGPLVRLESSRNRNTGGHGLGLHIARNTVTAHRGEIGLRNREEGGLEVTITLPLHAVSATST